MRPKEGLGVVRRGEPLRVDDESWFWTSEGARVESVDGREGVCRVCGDIWGVSGCLCKKKVVSGLSRELCMPGQICRAGQCSVLQPLVCQVPPVLGGGGLTLFPLFPSFPRCLFWQSVSRSVGCVCSSSETGGKRKWFGIRTRDSGFRIQGLGIPLRRVPLSCTLSPHG